MADRNVQPKYTKIFINNEFVDAVSGKTFQTINPTNKKVIANVAESGKADVDNAVAAAKKAFARKSEWRTMVPESRSKLMMKLCALMERDQIFLANLESLDNGKPFAHSLRDVNLSITWISYYAGWTDKICGETIPAANGLHIMTKREPIGVVGQIIPWNYPILMTCFKWSPALAAGCTIVMKPSELTPLTCLHLAALTKEAGFPNGVINVVPGHGPICGAAISEHPDVRKVAFTGSIPVGKLIMEAAARTNLKRITLELGGKSPLIICDDADIDKAVEIAHRAVFTNAGQVCIAASRTFVHESIYNEFVEKAVAKAKSRKLGCPFAPDTVQGPQIDGRIFNKVLRYIESGVKEGAKLQCGGKRYGTEGFFIEPTVFSDLTDDMKIAKEEIFGPVQSIFKYSTMEEVIERANSTEYGLAAGIVTNDLNKATKLSEVIEAGTIWINCYAALLPLAPFGGFKQSGIGREMGKDGILCYMETKTITMKTN